MDVVWVTVTVTAHTSYTLLARAANRISPKPMDYHLGGLPYDVVNEMRYLSPGECATAATATALCLIWLCLGRGAERSIGRTYERAFLEHVSEEPGLGFYVDLCQRQWDRFCPIFFQRRVFVPRWNRKTHSDVHDHIAAYRSKDFREHRHALESAACRGAMYYGASVRDGGPPPIIEETPFQKLAAGVLMALGSFTASSPHFFLNLMTVFCSSMGLGMSLSLQCMETGRGPSDDRNTNKRSIFSPFSLNTVVIAFLIIGNLVGSSGGVVFLAEFIVTSVSLVLGGAGTISASAMESWGCFICLSSTAFLGLPSNRWDETTETRNIFCVSMWLIGCHVGVVDDCFVCLGLGVTPTHNDCSTCFQGEWKSATRDGSTAFAVRGMMLHNLMVSNAPQLLLSCVDFSTKYFVPYIGEQVQRFIRAST